MARISSEEAVKAVGDRFLLVLMAAQRTKELKNGSQPKVDPKGNTESIVAIREIEQGLYTKKDYLEALEKKERNNEHHSSQGKRNSERNPRFDPLY